MKENKGLRRLIRATGYSASGLRAAWRKEEAFRQELILAVVLVPVALWLDFPLLERLLLIAVVVLVLVVELLNSAIEAVVDRVGLEHNELSGQAKDLGSAAVLLSLLLAAMVWIALCYSYLRQTFG